MKAIVTKYLGPGNVRGSRIVASDEDGNRVTIGVDNSEGVEHNHWRAAFALCKKMGWSGTLIMGGYKAGHVFVWADPRETRDVPAAAIVCAKCGEESGAHGSSMYGSVHKYGPRGHAFKPRRNPWTPEDAAKMGLIPQPCKRCGRELGPERFLGAVCGKCVRELHREAMGERPAPRPRRRRGRR